jgi:hypothetical protein
MENGQQLNAKCMKALAVVSSADVGKWSNPSPLQGGAHQLRGFKSRRRLHLKAPVEAATSTRAVITTAEAMATRNSIMRFLAVGLKEIHSDLPQLPYRM